MGNWHEQNERNEKADEVYEHLKDAILFELPIDHRDTEVLAAISRNCGTSHLPPEARIAAEQLLQHLADDFGVDRKEEWEM